MKEYKRLRGGDADSAIREWIKKEITEAPIKGYDLGKFFFAVSTGAQA